MRQVPSAAILGLGLAMAAALGAASGPAQAAPGDEILTPPPGTEQWFQVFAGAQRTGHAYRKVTRAFDTVILEERFQAFIKDRPARIESVVVYRIAKPLGPAEARVTTFLGETKLMEGSVTFGPGEGGAGRVAHVEITGYADKTLRVLSPPQKKTLDVPVPDGLVILQPALLYLAPRLLAKEGKLEGIVYAKFPEDIDFPDLISFRPDHVLERSKPDDTGNASVTLKILQKGSEGTRIVPLAKVTVDAKGELVEYAWARFVLKPSTQAEATAPTGAAPAPPAKK